LKCDRAVVLGKFSLPRNPAPKINADSLQILPETAEFAGAEFDKELLLLFETIPSTFPEHKSRFAPE
jgi:hypothetical protein